MHSSYRHWIATALAHAALADAQQSGALAAHALRARAAASLGADAAWLRPWSQALARHLAACGPQHTLATLADHIAAMPQLDPAFECDTPPRVRRLLLRPARMAAPAFTLAGLQLPPLATTVDLSEWLQLEPEELQWLLSPAQHFRERMWAPGPDCPPGLHYRALLKPKADGRLRLIELPLPRLKAVQRRILSGLLDAIPAHECAHGFAKGRGVLSHAAAHAGQQAVLAFDLRDFFHSVGGARVRALWRALGYPEPVAAALAGLCTVRTPRGVRERLLDAASVDALGAKRLGSPHLPQGAPTSPALANLCAFGLDLRLEGLAWRFGARYTRYADDLVFSGPASLLRRRRVLQAWVEAIAAAEGFRLHPGKTRVMPAHAQQRVTGVVVNERPNLPREAYDRLRARLHQLSRGQPCEGGLLDRLRGEVAWAAQLVCPGRAAKLQRLLAAVPRAKAWG